MSTTLLVATKNQGKIKEFAQLMAHIDINWLGLSDIQETMEVAETGSTFRANALLKARAYAQATGYITLADDSGLEVAALNGAPGVLTARYGGPGLTAAARYQYLLQQMVEIPAQQRSALFRCVIICCNPDGEILGEGEGICAGMIAMAPAGTGGFGYDPVFYLPERQLTMAQLPAAEKHQISHRGQALRSLMPLLQRLGAIR